MGEGRAGSGPVSPRTWGAESRVPGACSGRRPPCPQETSPPTPLAADLPDAAITPVPTTAATRPGCHTAGGQGRSHRTEPAGTWPGRARAATQPWREPGRSGRASPAAQQGGGLGLAGAGGHVRVSGSEFAALASTSLSALVSERASGAGRRPLSPCALAQRDCGSRCRSQAGPAWRPRLSGRASASPPLPSALRRRLQGVVGPWMWGPDPQERRGQGQRAPRRGP